VVRVGTRCMFRANVGMRWGGRRDLNPRHSVPQVGIRAPSSLFSSGYKPSHLCNSANLGWFGLVLCNALCNAMYSRERKSSYKPNGDELNQSPTGMGSGTRSSLGSPRSRLRYLCHRHHFAGTFKRWYLLIFGQQSKEAVWEVPIAPSNCSSRKKRLVHSRSN
jgi:hypothetical protein